MFLVLIVVLGYFLAGLVAVIVLARSLARREISLVWKIGAPLGLAFVVWAIPYGDHTFGKYKFQRMCTQEAGTRIYKIANQVKGVRSPYGAENTPSEYGYQFWERDNSDGTVDRFSLLDGGTVKSEKRVASISRYRVIQSRYRAGRQFTRTRTTVVDTESNEILAEKVEIGHAGGWLHRQLSDMYSYRAWCPKESPNSSQLARSVLKAK